MSVKVFESREVQDLLKAASNAGANGANGGNARTQQVVLRLLGDLFKAIDDLDITPDEVWAGVNYLNKLGRTAKRRCSRPASASRSISTSGWMPRTRRPASTAARRARSKGRCTWPAHRCATACRRSTSTKTTARPLVIHGTVTGLDGKPVAGAVVECWHANSHGFYSHFDPTGKQSEFNLRGAVRTGADGKYEFRTLMPVGYGCPPQGATQQLLNGLGRHGNRPAHVHFFVDSPDHRKLTTQFNIDGDPLIWDDFAYATREELIPPVVAKTGGTALGMKADAYQDIEFNFVLTPRVQGKDNQIVHRPRAAATA